MTFAVSLTMCVLMFSSNALAQQPAETPSEAARRHDALGVAAGDAGNLAIAVQEFETATRLDPNYAPAYFHMGLARERAGRTREALDAYQQALRIAPDLFEARYGLSSVAAKLGDLDGAIALLRQIVAAFPDLGEAHYNLGLNLWNRYKETSGPRRSEDLDAALGELRTAARLTPAQPNVHAALGQLLAEKQELQPAIESLRKSVELTSDPLYAYDLGLALRLAGDLDGAEAQFRATLRKVPAHGFAHRALGLVLRQKGDLEGAAAELRSAVEILPSDAQAHHLLGSVLLKLNRDGALDALERAVALDPNLTEARVMLAQLLARAGRKDEAERQLGEVEFSKAYEAGISRAMISIENAAHATRGEDRAAAIKHLWEAVGASPGFPEGHYQLALALLPSDAKSSEAHFVRVTELDAGHAPAHYQLGVLRARRGDAAGAMASLRRAIELAPGFIDAHRELAAQAWKQEDWASVLASLRAIVVWDPGDANAHYALSRALAQQGDHAGAARELAIARRLKP